MDDMTEDAILDKMLEPIARCLTPAVAQQIVELRADPTTQARIDELAAKSNEGELTETEQQEYAAYVEAIDLVGILQAKARAILANPPYVLTDAAGREPVRSRAGNRGEYPDEGR
jgi:hypothetical protein